MTVFYIIVPAFLLVGLWLYYYNRKKSGFMREYAARHGLAYSRKAPGLDEELDRVFGLKTPYVRGFMLVRDVITDGPVRMMRFTELLDLVPYAQARNTHFPRLAAYFPALGGPDLILGFGHGTSGPRVMYPAGADVSGDERVVRLVELLSEAPPPHPFTITLMNGKVLVYLEPVRVGSEAGPEADYLLGLAKRLGGE